MKFEISKKDIPHRLNPLYYTYNEYVNIPSKRKEIFHNSQTTLDEKLKEYERLKQRERKLKKILTEESVLH